MIKQRKENSMELKKKINTPASFFYGKVIESVLYDIKEQTGEKLSESQLEGFEYLKTFSKNSRGKIEIENIINNSTYTYKTFTNRNSYEVSYVITSIDEKSCEVLYTETMNSIGFLQKINDTIFGFILAHFKKKQFFRMLESIEASY